MRRKEGKSRQKEKKGIDQWTKMQMAFFYQSASFDVYIKIQKAPHEYSGFSKTEKENYVINPNIKFHL